MRTITIVSLITLSIILVACGGRVQESCGGIAGKACPEGYTCDVRSSEPDALGTCVPGASGTDGNSSGTPSGNPQCGGIAGLRCPQGYTCQLQGTYPDAGGVCVKLDPRIAENPSFCYEDADCVRQDIACDCGSGLWVNKAAYQPLPPDTVRCKCALREASAICFQNQCTVKQ